MPPRNRTPINFGAGLDRESGLMVVEPTSFADLRNCYLHEGKVVLRKGFTSRGSGEFTESDLIVGGHALRSQALGIVVGYDRSSELVHVYRCTPDLSSVELVGEWENDKGWSASIPRIIMAESYGRVFMAHDEPSVGLRAPTVYYDSVGTGSVLKTLTSDWADGTPGESVGESAESQDPDNFIRFRGVVRHLSYLAGWGFGSATDVRPEFVRFSLPARPTEFELNGYVIVGDRNDDVIACGPVGGFPAVLKAWKRQETYDITGYDRRTFSETLADPRFGIIASRAWGQIGDAAVAWSEEGPRLWTGEGPSQPLEIPLGLEEWEASDLVDEGEESYVFAQYVPRERVLEFHFNRRVYALTARIPGRWRWSYGDRPFDVYGGMIFYEGEGELEAPEGFPDYNAPGETTNPTEPAGTFADVAWRNFQAAGDETVEVWLRPRDGGLEQSSSGKILRRVGGDASEPWDTGGGISDWTAFQADNFSIQGSGSEQHIAIERVGGGSYSVAYYNQLAARAKALIHGRIRLRVNGGRVWGVCGQIVDAEETFHSGEIRAEHAQDVLVARERDNGTQIVSDVVNTDPKSLAVWYKVSLFVDGTTIIRAYDFTDDVAAEVASGLTLSTGRIGFMAQTGAVGSRADFGQFFVGSDRYVTCTGLSAGQKLKVLDAGDVVLGEATEVSGTAQVDMLPVWPEDAVTVIVTASDDTELSRIEPTDGVWGGDAYAFSSTTTGAWFLAGSFAVSTLAQQKERVTGLDPGTNYDVALRYRRGLKYNNGAEDTNDPSSWPSVSRGEFTTALDPAAISAAVWARNSGVEEGITLTIVPDSGNPDEDIKVYRRAAGEGSPTLLTTLSGPHADPLEYEDTTISGETAYFYTVTHDNGVDESPHSAETRIWSGPPEIPVHDYLNGLLEQYQIGWSTDETGHETEAHDTYDDAGGVEAFSLRGTEGAGAGGAGTGEFTSPLLANVPEDGVGFHVKLRHKATAFSVDDFGEFSPGQFVQVEGDEFA